MLPIARRLKSTSILSFGGLRDLPYVPKFYTLRGLRMTQEHPITPPPELVEEWIQSTRSNDCIGAYPENYEYLVATQAARWGADQELEASCHEVQKLYGVGRWLRSIRRPEPPSLKERALKELAWVDQNLNMPLLNQCDAIHTIRRALEALPD